MVNRSARRCSSHSSPAGAIDGRFWCSVQRFSRLTFGTVFIVTQTLQMFGVSPQLASMLFAPILLILISIGYATQYPIYRSLIEPSDSEILPD